MVTSRFVTIDGVGYVPQNDEMSLKKAVSHQPIAVGLEFYNLSFTGKRVFNGLFCSIPNHNVLIVGYGTSEEKGDYWLIHNSFGPAWGDEIYFRLKRSNIQNSGGISGITYNPVYPIKLFSSSDLLSPNVKDTEERR
ncbi:hypothetical protein EUTSA_v10009969mg [Eutrema salsugineum]|uniref:Peptidase C1A papain C-terminal domain-containing protein n=1 Tax=Eutrema salsugineum TaxID=72664 RepID=V4KPX8_EUTSA|nr:probable cysteine protease RDL3 [Eutrema salsugineum]ESQ33374.1 hypothetical protein EUTSA_v10009969mg [Eutrema salsugineum]